MAITKRKVAGFTPEESKRFEQLCYGFRSIKAGFTLERVDALKVKKRNSFLTPKEEQELNTMENNMDIYSRKWTKEDQRFQKEDPEGYREYEELMRKYNT